MKNTQLKVTHFEDIQYNKIDVEIRPLIEGMNKIKGIRTLFSCSGHKLGEQGYITFKSDSQECLNELLLLLPKDRQRMGFIDNRPFYCCYWVNAEIMPEYGLVYSLRFEGYPFYMQRELIKKIEDHING